MIIEPGGSIILDDNSIEITLGGNTATFDGLSLNLLSGNPKQLQICVDGSNAFLYENCTSVSTVSFPITSTSQAAIIGLLGTPITLNNSFTVSVIIIL